LQVTGLTTYRRPNSSEFGAAPAAEGRIGRYGSPFAIVKSSMRRLRDTGRTVSGVMPELVLSSARLGFLVLVLIVVVAVLVRLMKLARRRSR
jgi:hypothetical protein